MSRATIVGLVLAVVLAGCAGATASPQLVYVTSPPASQPTPQVIYVTPDPSLLPTPAPTPASEREEYTFKGRRSKQTEAFALAGGDYVISWVAEGKCFHGVNFDRTGDEPFFAEMITNEILDDGRVEDQTFLYDIEPGRYYFDVNSGCDWSISIAST